VQALVRPGIECLRRELQARDKILNLNDSLLEQDNDLEMLLSITGGADKNPASAGDFKAIISRATEHLKVGLSALIVPEKGIAMVQVSTDSPIDTAYSPRRTGICCRWRRCGTRPRSSIAWC
jgi:hypothetical protein